MQNLIREFLTVETTGSVTVTSPELTEGSKVQVLIVFENGWEEMDETDYLLSTEANKERMDEAVEELKHPDNFVPIDMEEYEKRLANSSSTR